MAEKEGTGVQAGKAGGSETAAPREKTAAVRERSCGAVVICTDGGITRWLLIRSLKGVWGFPKGHMEALETERRTALREIREETGLDVVFIRGFRKTDEYTIYRKDAPAIDKTVVYYLAHYENQMPVPQASEISEIKLFDFEGAMKRLSFEGSRQILAAAQRFWEKWKAEDANKSRK